jgi:putative hemolysin
MLQKLDIQASRAAYTVRLARSAEELALAQALRFRVFYDELNATGDADGDSFDSICDHLIVVDGDDEIVGTYRLLRQDVAEAHGGFYTESEFAIRPLIERKAGLRFLELGRSCVLSEHRTKPVIDLLWQGIWNYVRAYRMDVMFGCASLEGANAASHAETLAYLWRNHAPPAEWHASALPERAASVPQANSTQDMKQLMRSLPPLVKGYVRLGCYIGEGAVEDHQFGTTDVLIILPVSNINPRYFEKFGPPIAE